MLSDSSSPDFSNLPEDIIYNIFEYLNFGDQLAAGSTCKLWRNVFFSKTVQKSKELHLPCLILEDILPPSFFLLKSRKPFVNVHLIETYLIESSRMISYIGEIAHSLILDNMGNHNEEFVELLKNLKNLKSLTIKNYSHLSMSGITATAIQQLGEVMSSVCHLALPKNQYLTDYTFYNLTNSIKVLKSLDMSYCPITFHNSLRLRFYPNTELEASDEILTFKYVSEVILKHKMHLEHLNLSSTIVSNAALDVLASADEGKSLQLRELYLASCNELSQKAVVKFLQTQSNLMVLSLAGSRCVNDNVLKTLVEYLPRIEKLMLENCKNLTNEGLAFIAKLKNLRYLNISNCNDINGDGIKTHLNQSNDRLEILKMCRLKLCEESVIAIAKYCRQLRVLDLSYCCTGVTDRSMYFIIKNLRWLRSLFLENSCALTDCAFTSSDFEEGLTTNDSTGVNITNLKGLQNLNLNYCSTITDVTIFAIRFKELRQLCLSHCYHITIEGFESLAHFCPSLEEIDLCDCCHVTDEVIGLLTHKLHRLRRLHINGCVRLTPICIEYILRNCKILKVLSIQRCPQLDEAHAMLIALSTIHRINIGI